jgi:hypothetical protein
MIKPLNLKIAGYVVCLLVIVCVVALVRLAVISPQGGPKFVFTAFDPKTGMAVVVLTNTTSRSWSFRLNVVQGSLKPAYWIAPEKGIPGWGLEYEEGIWMSGCIYSRDSSGRYTRSDLAGSGPHLTAGISNVVLQPQQFLTFSIPVRDIRGLSKVGAKYHPPPPSSRLGRAASNMYENLRLRLHLKPAPPFEGWCETLLPAPTNGN